MKNKILFLGRFPPPVHGAAKMNNLYYNSLKKSSKFKVQKIKLNSYSSLEDIGKINKSKISGYIKTVKKLIKKIQKFNPDILYIEMAPMGKAFYKDSIFVIIGKLFKKNIFIHFHAKGASETTKNKFAEKYYKFIFKNTKIILLSKILFNDIKNVAKWKQVHILPNSIPDEITDRQFKRIIKARSKNKRPIFLFLSNMIESKGPLDVLKICNELNKKEVDFECNFVGKFQDEGFRDKFQKQLVRFKLEKKCKYLGAKYGKNKRKILERTSLLIFPTKYPKETFGLVIIEAFMYGIPAFSYEEGSMKEIITKDYLGHITKKKEWRELLKEIQKRIIKREDESRIRDHFKRKFNFKISEKNFLEILEKNS